MARSVSTDSTPNLTNGSISTCDDIEGGYSSHEDEGNEHAQGQLIVPKHIMVGSYSRRKSRCENLPVRRYSRPANASVDNSLQDATYRRCMKQSRSDATTSSLNPFTVLMGIIFFVLAIGITYTTQQSRIESLQQHIQVLHQARRHVEESHGKLTQELKTASHNLSQYKSTHEKMKKINHEMTDHIRRLREESSDKNSDADARAQRAEGRFQNVVDSIRSASAQQVLQKYGPGPHFVELTVKLPNHQDLQVIKLELASIDTVDGMPHAVHTFLDQVDMGAWNGASFGFHAGHVLLAVPSQRPKSTKVVPTVLFPEYSPAYSHEEYTVAFPGRPGTGQDFYINVQSNTQIHAPRIQDGEFVEGEPCFAKISDVESRRVVDDMDKIAVVKSGRLSESVVIHEAKIVSHAESMIS
ncbi:hypothetical protein ACHAWO_013518 [Cyclotella atomus]|uniref:PPIase cyclophilin-type domain-containing protein n=1 Tax=Cyclotella atomus TaxID=382360 RepID=A0ABD3N7M4_9STRA